METNKKPQTNQKRQSENKKIRPKSNHINNDIKCKKSEMPVTNGNRKLKNKKQIKPKAQLYAWIPHFFFSRNPL